MKKLGFDKPLYILPFDHRASFQSKLFGWSGKLTPQQTAEIAASKLVIYHGFEAALQAGVPERKAGILLDEQIRLGNPDERTGARLHQRMSSGKERTG
jgi:5-dehydro-2-deoxygluconokinase